MRKLLFGLMLAAFSSTALAQYVYTNEYSDSELYNGITYSRTASNVLILVEASMGAHEDKGGDRVTSQGYIDVTLNGKRCGYDSDYAHEHESMVGASVTCIYPWSSGPFVVGIKAVTAGNGNLNERTGQARISLLPINGVRALKDLPEHEAGPSEKSR